MRILSAILLFACFGNPAYANTEFYQAVVADPYIELHTGPGQGYPIFHVVDEGEKIDIIKRRTSWFRVRTARGVKGWVSISQLTRTLDTSGEPTDVNDPGKDDFTTRRWEMGVLAGDFEGANVISTYGAYSFTANISAELSFSQITGDISNGWMVNANIIHVPFPEWRVMPFLTLGTGVIRIEPKATLVQVEDRTDQIGHVGAGIRTYLSQRFVFRAEYKSYVVFTSRDDNEEVDEWKLGFSFFF